MFAFYFKITRPGNSKIRTHRFKCLYTMYKERRSYEKDRICVEHCSFRIFKF